MNVPVAPVMCCWGQKDVRGEHCRKESVNRHTGMVETAQRQLVGIFGLFEIYRTCEEVAIEGDGARLREKKMYNDANVEVGD